MKKGAASTAVPPPDEANAATHVITMARIAVPSKEDTVVGYGNPDVATVEAGARLEAGTLLEGEPTRSSSSVKVGNRSHSIENYPEE